jgi:phenylpyruvate tautomerase PptA (4-oxalocrotonate tautomerase family)
MACIELSTAQQAELIQVITQSVVAAAGDKQRAAELFVESMEAKGIGWLASIVFCGVVKDVKPWHSGYDIEFAAAFTNKHRE